MNQLDGRLHKRIEELFPMPPKHDILEEIKVDRIRSAFREGIHFAFEEILKLVPLEDKTKPAAYNQAWNEAIDKCSELHHEVFEYYTELHNKIMAEYDNRNTNPRKEVIPHH